MNEVSRYSPEWRKEWDLFVSRTKSAHFFFFRDYMEYHSDRFKDHSLLFFEGEKLVALLPANIVNATLHSHQGLSFGGLLLPPNFSSYKMQGILLSLVDYCKDAGIEELVYKALPHIYHQQPAEEDLYFLSVAGADLFRRDCNSVIDLNRVFKISQGKKSGRNQAKKAGVEISETEDFESFFSIANRNLESKYSTTAVHSAAELKTLRQKFPKNIKLYGAFFDNQMIAGALIFITNDVAHAQYLASSDTGKELRAMDLVILTLIDAFKSSYRYFSFGISTEDEGKKLNQGLLKQKEEYGAQAICHDFYRLLI